MAFQANCTVRFDGVETRCERVDEGDGVFTFIFQKSEGGKSHPVVEWTRNVFDAYPVPEESYLDNAKTLRIKVDEKRGEELYAVLVDMNWGYTSDDTGEDLVSFTVVDEESFEEWFENNG